MIRSRSVPLTLPSAMRNETIPTTLQEALVVINDLREDIRFLQTGRDTWWTRNVTEKVLLAFVAAIVTIFGGLSLRNAAITQDKVDNAEVIANQKATNLEEKVEDVKKEVRRKRPDPYPMEP